VQRALPLLALSHRPAPMPAETADAL